MPPKKAKSEFRLKIRNLFFSLLALGVAKFAVKFQKWVAHLDQEEATYGGSDNILMAGSNFRRTIISI